LQASRRLESCIDRNEYDEANLIDVKVPVTGLPYAVPTDWERVDGEVIIADIAYRFVKHRIVGDSLELLCVRDAEETAIGKAGTEFFGKVNSFPNSKPGPQKDSQKLFGPADFTAPMTALIVPETEEIVPPPASILYGHPSRLDRPPAFA
jgi:hypothetical protein